MVWSRTYYSDIGHHSLPRWSLKPANGFRISPRYADNFSGMMTQMIQWVKQDAIAWVLAVIFGESYRDSIYFNLLLFRVCRHFTVYLGAFTRQVTIFSIATGEFKCWKTRHITDSHTWYGGRSVIFSYLDELFGKKDTENTYLVLKSYRSCQWRQVCYPNWASQWFYNELWFRGLK